MTALTHPWQSDADRAADAIVSLRNDEIAKHLSRNFHDQFNARSGTSLPAGSPRCAGAGSTNNQRAGVAGGDSQ